MKKILLLAALFLSVSFSFSQDIILRIGDDTMYLNSWSELRIVPQEDNVDVLIMDMIAKKLYSYPLEIEVELPPPVLIDSIYFNKTDLVFRPGEADDVYVIYEPFYADIVDVVWSSDDESIATIDEDGTIRAVSHGVVTVKATSVDGGHVAQCKVTVVQMSGSYTDSRDEVEYGWVRINNTLWMTENLKFLTWVNEQTDRSLDEIKYYIYEYEDQVVNIEIAKSLPNYRNYGVLYNWAAAQSACPEGWRLPGSSDWTEIENLVGGDLSIQQVEKLKATSGWNNGENGTDDFGFGALPGGMLEFEGFMYIGDKGYWWSKTEYQGGQFSAYCESIQNGSKNMMTFIENKARGLSVRCVKDADVKLKIER